MEIIYKKIVDMFNSVEGKAVFTTRFLPVPKQIDINYGQPDNPENFEVFCPGIYIAWQITPNADNEPKTLTLDFHVLQEPGIHTENYSTRLPEGIEYLAMLKAIKFLLTALRATNTTGLKYAGERPAVTPYFRYHILSFTCFIDVIEESLTKGTVSEVELDDYVATYGIKNRTVPLPTSIDTF